MRRSQCDATQRNAPGPRTLLSLLSPSLRACAVVLAASLLHMCTTERRQGGGRGEYTIRVTGVPTPNRVSQSPLLCARSWSLDSKPSACLSAWLHSCSAAVPLSLSLCVCLPACPPACVSIYLSVLIWRIRLLRKRGTQGGPPWKRCVLLSRLVVGEFLTAALLLCCEES